MTLIMKSSHKFAYVAAVELSKPVRKVMIRSDHYFLSNSNMNFYKIPIMG